VCVCVDVFMCVCFEVFMCVSKCVCVGGRGGMGGLGCVCVGEG
jgi:hypothetical protein